MSDYIKYVDDYINKKEFKDINSFIKEHLIKINFFQHERLIHLLVTLFYGLLAIVFMAFGFVYYLFFIIAFILLICLMFYGVHYFRLERGVQYLYKQYDMMKKNTNKS